MKFTVWCVGIVVAIFVLWKAYHFIKYTPWQKSEPQYYLTLKGHIDPNIKKDFKFYMQYSTNARSCDRVNYIEGVRGVRVKTFPVDLSSDSQGNYQVEIPLDKFYKGFCGWGAYKFMFRFERVSSSLIAFFQQPKGVLPKKLFLCCGYNIHHEESCDLNGRAAYLSPFYNYEACKNCNLNLHVSIK